MRRVVVVSVVLVLVLFFGGADGSYAATSWRITGAVFPGSSAGAPYFPFNMPNTAWSVATSARVGGYASLMYLQNYFVGDGLPFTFTSSPVFAHSSFYCDNFYNGCTGNLVVPNSYTASGVYSFGTYLFWLQTGTQQKEVASGHIDVIPDWLALVARFVVPSNAPSGSVIKISWRLENRALFHDAWVEEIYYAWYGQTGWRQHSFGYDELGEWGQLYIGGDDYKIDDNVTVENGHLLVMFKIKRKMCAGYTWLGYCDGTYNYYYGYIIRDVWVGDYELANSLSGGVVQMPETGFVDVKYQGGWYPVGVPVDLEYTCNWTSKPAFLSAKGKGGCELEGIPDSEGMYEWGLTVTASNGDNINYSGKIIVRRFEDAVSVPGGTGLTSWVIGLTNTGSTAIGEVVSTLDHARVVFTNAFKSLNVTVDDSLSNFDTSKITQFVAFGKSMLPPGAGLPIAAWIAVTGVDVVVGFIGLMKGIIKWW